MQLVGWPQDANMPPQCDTWKDHQWEDNEWKDSHLEPCSPLRAQHAMKLVLNHGASVALCRDTPTTP